MFEFLWDEFSYDRNFSSYLSPFTCWVLILKKLYINGLRLFHNDEKATYVSVNSGGRYRKQKMEFSANTCEGHFLMNEWHGMQQKKWSNDPLQRLCMHICLKMFIISRNTALRVSIWQGSNDVFWVGQTYAHGTTRHTSRLAANKAMINCVSAWF